ncbi:MAG: type II secretion system protein [Vicinamibacterales bacterium]
MAQRGYAMAALLVGLTVMSVLMGAMLPVWSHMVQRDKEEELVFRGQQYARAIGLFQRKFANTPPPSVDVLVEQRFLRKKYKDPITKDDFQPIYANQAALGVVSAPTGARQPGQVATAQLGTPPAPISVAGGTAANGAAGGIIGVTSKSKDTSIRLYNGRDKYNEWAFIYLQTAQRVGGPVGAQGNPGGPAGPNGGPFGMGGRGGPGGPGGQGRGQQPFGNPGSQPNRPPFPGGSTFQPFGTPQPGQTQPGTMRPPGATRPPGA